MALNPAVQQGKVRIVNPDGSYSYATPGSTFAPGTQTGSPTRQTVGGLGNFLGMFNYNAPVSAAAGSPVPTGTTLPGGPVSGYDPAYGGVPSVPSPGATQADTLLNNLNNLANLYKLTTGTSGASAAGAETQLQQNLPGYAGARDKSMANTNSLLAGQVPDDVWRVLQQRGAERGVQTGAPGSPNSNAALMAALGLTSIGLQQQGEQNLTGAIGRTPRGPAFDPSTMLLNPQMQQEWQYLANLLKAAPIPASAAAANINALRSGVGGGFRTPRSNTPFNFTPPNPFQQEEKTPFRGGVAPMPTSPVMDFANMSEEDLMNYITGFPAGWRAGDTIGNAAEPFGPANTGYADEAFPFLDDPQSFAYGPPAPPPVDYGGGSVGDMFPGFGGDTGGDLGLDNYSLLYPQG